MINYSKKIQQLDYKYDIGLRRSELKEVVAKCQRTKANFSSDTEWLSALDSMLLSVRNDPLQNEIKEQVVAVSQLCPICGKQAQPITLMANRKAYYCKAHRAVSPAMINE